jgi:hypothetical protein
LRKTLLVLLLVVASASNALAHTVNLGWGSGQAISVPAPTSDAGYNSLVISMTLSEPLEVAAICVRVGATFSGPVPDWWKSICAQRGSSWMAARWIPPAGMADPSRGTAMSTWSEWKITGTNTAGMFMCWAWPCGTTLAANTTYYAGSVTISNVGTSVCTGSDVPGEFAFSTLEIGMCDGSRIYSSLPGAQSTILWAAPTTAAQRPTWGMLKTIYR